MYYHRNSVCFNLLRLASKEVKGVDVRLDEGMSDAKRTIEGREHERQEGEARRWAQRRVEEGGVQVHGGQAVQERSLVSPHQRQVPQPTLSTETNVNCKVNKGVQIR